MLPLGEGILKGQWLEIEGEGGEGDREVMDYLILLKK